MQQQQSWAHLQGVWTVWVQATLTAPGQHHCQKQQQLLVLLLLVLQLPLQHVVLLQVAHASGQGLLCRALKADIRAAATGQGTHQLLLPHTQLHFHQQLLLQLLLLLLAVRGLQAVYQQTAWQLQLQTAWQLLKQYSQRRSSSCLLPGLPSGVSCSPLCCSGLVRLPAWLQMMTTTWMLSVLRVLTAAVAVAARQTAP